jgi:hypothetical protein
MKLFFETIYIITQSASAIYTVTFRVIEVQTLCDAAKLKERLVSTWS